MKTLKFISLILITLPLYLSAQITPAKNQNDALMKEMVDTWLQNSPNVLTSYNCILYSKMQFKKFASINSSAFFNPDSLFKNDVDHNSLLIETITGVKHILPDKTSSQPISERVDGDKDPTLVMMFNQVNPFIFYHDEIYILNADYINPLSKKGLQAYSFEINDTLYSATDTTVIITFTPKKKLTSSLTGKIEIQSKSHAVSSINIKSTNDQSPVNASITQNFKHQNDQLWFPYEMNSFLRIHVSSQAPVLIANGKSFVTAIKIIPTENTDSIKQTPVQNSNPNFVSTPDNLQSKKDYSTQYLIDSLATTQRHENIEHLQKQMIEGFIPVGIVKIDYKKLVDYNAFEGWKFGLGLWTSDQLSKVIETGGYFVRSIKRSENKMGAGIRFHTNQQHQTLISFLWKDDFDETGLFSFLDGYQPYSPESFRRFLTETMDRSKTFAFKLQSLLSPQLKAAVTAQYKDVTPLIPYKFYVNQSTVENPFKVLEAGLQLKHSSKQLDNGTIEKKHHTDLWLNTTYGTGDGPISFSFFKTELQTQESFHLTTNTTTTIRITGGLLNGNFPTSILYSAFGSYKPLGIEVPHTFATMRLNEFAADRFAAVYLDHNIQLFPNSTGRFKPQLKLTTNLGIGEISKTSLHSDIQSFEKGYTESGFVINNLYSIALIDYGISVHYRYGPYQLKDNLNNWAFKFAIRFNVK